jgi:hypothetical protein
MRGNLRTAAQEQPDWKRSSERLGLCSQIGGAGPTGNSGEGAVGLFYPPKEVGIAQHP